MDSKHIAINYRLAHVCMSDATYAPLGSQNISVAVIEPRERIFKGKNIS